MKGLLIAAGVCLCCLFILIIILIIVLTTKDDTTEDDTTEDDTTPVTTPPDSNETTILHVTDEGTSIETFQQNFKNLKENFTTMLDRSTLVRNNYQMVDCEEKRLPGGLKVLTPDTCNYKFFAILKPLNENMLYAEESLLKQPDVFKNPERYKIHNIANRQQLLNYISEVQWWLDRLSVGQLKGIKKFLKTKVREVKFDPETSQIMVRDKVARGITGKNMTKQGENKKPIPFSKYLLIQMLYHKIHNKKFEVKVSDDWEPLKEEEVRELRRKWGDL